MEVMLRIKEIRVGDSYILNDNNFSNIGCSKKWFDKMYNKKIIVLEKINTNVSTNNVKIHALCDEGDEPIVVEFWCSSKDLGVLVNGS